MTLDALVVGAGVLGLSIARELKRRRPGARVAVLEKEPSPGRHASGRNSGVLHAGFYYAADSLKARLCREGNRELSEYCLARGLPYDRCGKLVLAVEERELPALEELARRGAANRAEVELVDAAAARRLEPRARPALRALWSPATASLDPAALLRALAEDASREGVELLLGRAYLGRAPGGARTSAGLLTAGHIVNAAGLHADAVARDFGFGLAYALLPFRGLYLRCGEPAGSFRRHIYPVPDPAFPFLGVHLTRTVSGQAKIGPTALPALSREHYGGLSGLRAGEAAEILPLLARLMAAPGSGLAGLALEELAKSRRAGLLARASRLVEGLSPASCLGWAPAGLRAQLVERAGGRFVLDFVVEGDAGSTHVLNAVSPGLTCALPFARLVCDRVPL